MPGDTSMRDQTSDKDRRKFTSGLIRAIEDLELRRINRSPQQLADAAWQKLQYDFPLVETEELQALLGAFRSSFVGKAGWPCYLLTQKALDNICQGARGAASYAPQLTEQEQQVQQMLSDSLSSKIASRSSGSSGNTRPQAQHQQQPQSQQQVYQQLAGVLLLQYAAKVASLPDQEAWQLLQAYCPDLEQVHDREHGLDDAHKQQQQQQQVPGFSDQADAVTAALAAAAGLCLDEPAATAAANGASSSCVVCEDTEAAQQDGDSEEYEPLEAAQHHPHHDHPRSLHQHHHNPQQHGSQHPQHLQQHSWGVSTPGHHLGEPQAFSWPDLHTKLLALADHVHYSLLSCEPLWAQHGAAQHLLTLLRLLGVHSHAQELQQLLHAYVGLLVDRLASAPQDLPLLHQLWEALGLLSSSQGHQGLSPQGPGGVSGHGGSKPQGPGQLGLHPEAVLGLTVAASVWQQLPGATARKQLWQLMFDDLLPLLEVCAEQLAYSISKAATRSSSSKVSSNSSSSDQPPEQAAAGGQAPTAAAGVVSAAAQGAAFAHVLLLSHVTQLLVLGRPGHVDVGQVLTQAGLTRSLVALHTQWGCEVSAEPLRRALLLACCSSLQTAAWVLAVPTLVQQLQQQCFKLGQPCESHGAMWQLLMHHNTTNTNTSSSMAQAAKQTASKGSSDGAEGRDEGLEQQLLSLLRLQGGSSVQLLQRQVVVLQLMVDAQAAAGRGQRLWSDVVSAALRKLAAQLKEMEGAASSGGTQAAAAANHKGSLSSSDTDNDSDSDSDVEHVDCAAAGAADGECGQSHQQQNEKEGGAARRGRSVRQQQQTAAADIAQLEHRRSAQLQPTALRLVKELLTQGGGKTD